MANEYNNKKTLLGYFGEKSSTYDEQSDLMDLMGVNPDTKQLLNTLLVLGIDPSKKKGALIKAGAIAKRSGKSLMSIFDEILGRGTKQIDEVVARKPIDTSYITGKNPNAVTMQDVLEGSQKSLNIPAFEREALGLVKRVSVGKSVSTGLSKKQLLENSVKSNESQIAKLLYNQDKSLTGRVYDISKRGRDFLPAITKKQGLAGPGMPTYRAQSDIMKILESISKTLSKGPLD
jgi:hypothetical protein